MLLFLLSFLYFSQIFALLDIDELNSVDYGIDILSKPVVIGQDDEPPGVMTMTLTSKYGQLYHCSYQQKLLVDEEKEKAEEKVAIETGIPELLRPMEGSPCLIHMKGWWSYEFCYGKEIKQYHAEDGKIVGEIMYLGFYETDFDWNNTSQRSKTRHQLSRYHSQQYVNGSQCDLTTKARRSEVRFQCEEGQGDYIARVDEPETCVYTITVHTMKICHHPFMKPKTPSKPISIACHPLLSVDEYAEWQAELAATNAAKEALIREAYLKSVAAKVAAEAAEEDEDDEETESSHNILNNKLMENLVKGLQDAFGVDGMKMKVVDGASDIESFIKESLAEANVKVAVGQAGAKTPDGSTVTGEEEENEDNKESLAREKHISRKRPLEEDEDEMTEEEEELLREFDEEFDSIASDLEGKSRLSKYKEEIENSLKSQFDEMVDEAEADLKEEGFEGDVDRNDALKNLASTLNKLLTRLDETQKDYDQANEDLETAEEALRQKLQEDIYETEDWLDEKTSTNTASDMKETSDKSAKADKGPEQTHTETLSALDDKFKVRVTHKSRDKTNSEASQSGALKFQKDQSGDSSAAAAAASANKLGTSHHIPAEQKEKLENTVKQELTKAGLNTQGRKVEVRIITAGYLDDDDETLHVLSDEDGSAISKMIIAVLGDNEEELREAQRHENMVSNYGFTLSKDRHKGRGRSHHSHTEGAGEDPLL